MTQKVKDYLSRAESQVIDVCLSNPKCAELVESARNLSKAGQFDAALTLYKNVYSKFPAPWILVNIGRTQQKLEQLPEAIATYRQYLSSKEVQDDPELTKKVQEYLHQAESDYEPPPPPLLVPTAPPAPPPPRHLPCPTNIEEITTECIASPPTVRQRRKGFVIELGFSGRAPLVQIDSSTSLPASSIGGTLFFGYKIDRVILGAGLAIDYLNGSTQVPSSTGTTTTTTASTTSYLVTPGLQVALVRAAAGRLELLAAVQVGLGQALTNRSQDPADPLNPVNTSPVTTFHLNYEVGPGLRYFVIPQFAVSLIAGVSGDHYFSEQDTAAGSQTGTLSSVSLFGTLGTVGVF